MHIADGDYDTGTILAQQTVALDPRDCAEDIERKVMAIEPALFVQTLRGIALGALTLPDPIL